MDAEEWVRIIAAALAGDRHAVERVVAALKPVIHARVTRVLLCCSLGRNVRQEVEDFSQGVFLSLFANSWRELRRWDPERGASLENFVGLVAKRHVISILRSRRQNPFTLETVDPDDPEPPGDAPDPLRRLVASEEQELLFERLRKRVTPLGWQMFHLLYVEELSVPEVMAKTEMSSDAVYAWRSRLGRLVDQLRRELSEPVSPPRIPPEDDEE
jgi:RNA polymerase sigma-70 factor (ECF subfamily)